MSTTPTGSVIVAEQLPESSTTRKTALNFIKAYQGAHGAGTRNAFGAYAYDAYLLADSAVATASKKASPGSADFRQALRDALEASKDVVGTHGVYTMSATDHSRRRPALASPGSGQRRRLEAGEARPPSRQDM